MATSPKKKSTGNRSFQKKRYFSVKRTIGLAVLLLFALLPLYYPFIEKKLSPAWHWAKHFGQNPNYPVYKSFHINIPIQYNLHGVDVSSYQGPINWEKVKQVREGRVHISFAFIKATEGITLSDPYFSRNLQGCRRAGIACGAYHYFKPQFGGKSQAKFFMENITLLRGDLPPVVDVEELGGQTPDAMRLRLSEFLKEIALKTNTKPIIYSGLKFYYDNLAGYYNNYPLWLSNFDHADLVLPLGARWDFWQHSNHAQISGILRGVDFDVFKGDSLAFRQLLVK